MSITFRMPGGDPEIMQWITDHGLDPHRISKRITIDDDGTVHLRQHLLRDGKVYAVGEEIASEPVTITPTRPFPRKERPKTRSFTVTTVHGHTETTTFNDSTPSYVEVVVRAENVNDESIELRYPIGDKPAVGDTIEIVVT